jgi:hypothetical protein
MDDWSFARPLPPGAFPDVYHLAGPRDAPARHDRKPVDRAEQPKPLRAR